MDSISSEVFPGDEPDQLRSATTILRSTLEEIASTAIEAAMAVGQVRFVGQLRGIEIEEGPEE
ncbi:MAG: hypothetical protein JNL21_38705 [Myxococcales bacterium]|nr:hypothetical protein [Myxococcales bacterium]